MKLGIEPAKKRSIELDFSNEKYHAMPAISSSQLKLAYRNIEMYKLSVIDKAVDYKQTAAFRIGTLFHEMILEPEIYQPVVYPAKKIDRRTKAYKDFMEDLSSEQAERLITLDEKEKLSYMQESLLSHKDCPDFASTMNEASVFYSWKGVELRTRPDAMCFKTQTIFDLKTTSQPVGKRDFLFHLQKYDYDLSAAMYIHSMSAHTGKPWSFCFVVVQTVEPYTSAIYYVGDNLFFQGFSKYEKAMKRIRWSETNKLYKFQEHSEIIDTYAEVEKFDATSYYKPRNHLTLGSHG